MRNATLSALFGALGPLFNKLSTFDNTSQVAVWLNAYGLTDLHFAYDVFCIALMLFANTISVKYKMLCMKDGGAFLGTTLIFSLGYLFSALLGFAINEPAMPLQRYLGVFFIIAGVMLISIDRHELAAKENQLSDIEIASARVLSTLPAELNSKVSVPASTLEVEKLKTLGNKAEDDPSSRLYQNTTPPFSASEQGVAL